jgi:hypothetical protein
MIASGGVTRSCGGRWDDAAMIAELDAALAKIASTPLVREPFPHIEIDGLFSACLYADLMAELPLKSAYTPLMYPGTDPTYSTLVLQPRRRWLAGADSKVVSVPGECCKPGVNASACGTGCFYRTDVLHKDAAHGHVLVVSSMQDRYPLWTQVFRFVHSVDFMATLVQRFMLADHTALPPCKVPKVRAPDTLRNTAALRIEPTRYHLSPHVDVNKKLVTWQYFHPNDRELEHRGVGTFFYEPKAEYRGSFRMQEWRHTPWLAYDAFDIVKEQAVIPNYFFAFAPNNRSFHGAAIDDNKMAPVKNKDARRTFLGFITNVRDRWHHFSKDDTADTAFRLQPGRRGDAESRHANVWNGAYGRERSARAIRTGARSS